MPKVIPMINEYGNTVKNQYTFNVDDCRFFQSYDDIVAKIDQSQVYIDIGCYPDMSVTTRKWLSVFLNVDEDEIKDNVDIGDYLLVSLN